MTRIFRCFLLLPLGPAVVSMVAAFLAGGALATETALKFGVGLFQPDREKNDATYRPLADYGLATGKLQTR